MERAEAELKAQEAQMVAEHARAGEGMGEARMQSLSLTRTTIEQIAADLRDTQAKLSEVVPKLVAAREQLQHSLVRAPASGRVVGLSVFTVGGVVAPGQTLMDVIPEDKVLVVQAQVQPIDADDVYPGQAAQIRFASDRDRSLPLLDGRVRTISADSFTDRKAGGPISGPRSKCPRPKWPRFAEFSVAGGCVPACRSKRSSPCASDRHCNIWSGRWWALSCSVNDAVARRMYVLKRWLGALALLAAPTLAAPALDPVFSDHAVIQRDEPIELRGTADPGEGVIVGFAGKSLNVRADRFGRWAVHFAAMRAGGPYRIQVTGSGRESAVADIMVGDVWLCSGQSNMEFPLRNALNGEAEVAAANDPQLRLLKVPHNRIVAPQKSLMPGVGWKATTSDSAKDFSAACYFMARALQQSHGVAVGAINSTWGGQPSMRGWTRRRCAQPAAPMRSNCCGSTARAQTGRCARTAACGPIGARAQR